MPNEREPLPLRRIAISWSARFYNREFAITAGLYPSGRIGEVFAMSDKIGSDMQALTRDGAILISLALQHGCPLETMQHAISRNPDNTASSFIGALIDELVRLDKETNIPEAAE